MTKDKKTKLDFKGMKKIIPYYKKYKGLFVSLVLMTVLILLVEFMVPIFSAQVLANLTNSVFNTALVFAGCLVANSFLVWVIRYYYDVIYLKLTRKVHFDIKNDLMSAIHRVTMQKNDEVNSGIYIERLNEDTNRCSDVFMDIIFVALEIIGNIGFLVFIAFINIWFFLIMLGYVAAMYLLDSWKEKIWFRNRKNFRDCREKSTGAYNEQIRGLRDIKSLNVKDSLQKDSAEKFDKALDINFKIRRTRGRIVLLRNTASTIFEFAFIFLGILFIQNLWLTLSGFLIIYMYQGNVKSLAGDFAFIKQYATEGEISASRIFEIIDDFPKEKFGDKKLDIINGEIEFENVDFAYEKDAPVLKNFSAVFENNKTTAIVGKSGCGKSTIISLINKLYKIDSGKIYLDGVDINKLSEDCLRGAVGIVNQIPYIFNTTIKENLKFIKPDATDDELIEVLKKAQIWDFIKSLKKGINSVVGENGVMLSGGQKQRLAIARILLKNSKIIVFDEATSALDNESQGKIVDVIENIKKDHTIIIVAHRLSTIVDADKIMILNDGKILEEGTHKELYRHCSLYKDLYKKEELSDKLENMDI